MEVTHRGSAGALRGVLSAVMTDQSASDDWVEGGELQAFAPDLPFFAGMSIPIDTSLLPEPEPPLVS